MPAALHILAAEDNTTNQLILRALLDVLGVSVEIVDNGQAAVAAAAASHFDLVLMNIQMPIMDGMSAVRAIRDHERALGRPGAPILAVTANVMSDQVADYLAAGMDGCVAKPLLLESLARAIESVFEQRPVSVDTA